MSYPELISKSKSTTESSPPLTATRILLPWQPRNLSCSSKRFCIGIKFTIMNLLCTCRPHKEESMINQCDDPTYRVGLKSEMRELIPAALRPRQFRKCSLE